MLEYAWTPGPGNHERGEKGWNTHETQGQGYQKPHDIQAKQVMMVSRKTSKPTWDSSKTSHDGIRKNIKTYMTFMQKKSWWYPEKPQNLHDHPR